MFTSFCGIQLEYFLRVRFAASMAPLHEGDKVGSYRKHNRDPHLKAQTLMESQTIFGNGKFVLTRIP